MNKFFIYAMYQEQEANKSKGDWNSWYPHPHTWLWETQYHMAKLQKAINNNDKKLIKEHSADLGLYAEKAYVKFGLSQKDRISKFEMRKMLKKPTRFEQIKKRKLVA